MLLPRMPFFFFSAATVVPLRLAIDDRVSPFLTVTLRPVERPFLLRLLLFETVRPRLLLLFEYRLPLLRL